MEYSKVRSTFGHLLMDYEPVAYPLSIMKSEIDELSLYLARWNSLSETEKLAVKIRSIEISIKASRQSIQSHGGYGYLQDFGVEKFYRDSATMPALFMEGQSDKISLSELSYNGKAGFL
jgi:alkylation response protein AidB-like acyl-CoA dehydrogenase